MKNELYVAEKLKDVVSKEVKKEPCKKDVSGSEEGWRVKEQPAV